MPRHFLRIGLVAALGVALLPMSADPASAARPWNCPMKQGVSFLGDVGGGHMGIDMGAGPFPYDVGRRVRAVVGGTVDYRNDDPGGYGRYISFRADAGRRFVYAHLKKARLVADGAHVKRGDPIGRVGQTGNATAPHLHFEARRKVTDQVMGPLRPLLSECEWLN
jgi:murein DD-endopeptidase MepM/ murein hydrolase activator NlpD